VSGEVKSNDEVTAILPTGASTPDSLPTAAVAPAASTRMGSSPTSGGGATTIGSPLEALERDEMVRTRRFCLIGAIIGVCGACAVAVLPGNPSATAAVLSSVGLSLAAIIFLYRRTSDPVTFRKPSTLLGWFIPAVCVTSALPYFGVFSPACVVLVLGIYFTGLGKSSGLASAVYLTCAGAQAVLAALVITRAIPDTGIVQLVPIGDYEKWVVQGLVQIVLLSTFVTARMSRKTALDAVSELERAVRFAAHREALLLEAREELERALLQGRGRFTDQTIGGYQLKDVIGRGAMGEVYAAIDAKGHQVAIKLLAHTSLGNINHVLRFLRELRTAAGIESANVVRVIEVGEKPVPYLVMEKLEGKTLAEMLRNKSSLPANDVLELVRQVGAGITAAAAAGIVHRDLKPQNVFLHRGQWKVLDFGVARAIDSGDTLTAGAVVGTPSYMAPEQASGRTVDHCTDLYALAAIAYRAITGHPPYAAGEIAETLYRVVHTLPRRPSELIPTLPPDVDLVLAIGLAKRPTDRFTSALELSDSLYHAMADTLPERIRLRGLALDRIGAWASPKHRPSTARMRGPGH